MSVFLGTNKNNPDYASSRAGFTRETDPAIVIAGRGAVHERVLSWYGGTTDLEAMSFPGSQESDANALFRRRGDGYYEHLFDQDFSFGNTAINPPRVSPWYRPEHTQARFQNAADDVPAEGIGTGWFYSVLGGGQELRPQTFVDRIPVDWDNSYDARMRGDFAVPTLFNGNFDAVFNPQGGNRTIFSSAIPGWSFHNGGEANSVSTNNLVDWRTVPSLSTYLTQVGYNPAQSNYALRLTSGDSITHNRFVVPDWGVLRLDLHTLGVSSQNPGIVSVSIQSDEPGYQNYLLNTISLSPASAGASQSDPMGQYANDRYKIGYGTQGFETFHFDLPPALRGKVATLKIEVNGGTVYLDNVFFQSKHLLFGNPTQNGQQAGTEIIRNVNNYLIEKPQYSLSYNSSKKSPNWVSYQLDQTWLGSASRKTWIQDPELPLLQAEPSDIPDALYSRGHLAANAHRRRNNKDVRATFLGTNTLAQHFDNNDLFLGETPNEPAWTAFEKYLTSLVENSSRQLYIIAGGYGSNPEPQRRNRYALPTDEPTKPVLLTDKGVTIPGWTWRIALVLDRANQTPNDVTTNATTYAILTPNTAEPENNAPRNPDGSPNNLSDFVNPVAHPFSTLSGLSSLPPINNISNKLEWRNWQNWRVTVNDIEALTRLDFLTNIPKDIQESIEETLSPVITP
ncbi:MAG TPA: DNA/RNA non-specific endonuclease [Candidatus Sericytochromatia bacterium]